MKSIKLNLGSGPAGIAGWLNYDSGILPMLSKFPTLRNVICSLGLLPKSYDCSWPEIQLVDIRNPFPLEDNSVDFIYCSQVLEHFERYEAKNVLTESLRVLKPGGTIRISIPDISKMFEVYLDLQKIDPANAARQVNITWWGYEKDLPPGSIFAKLSRLFIRDHQWHYDLTSIKELLKQSGFKKISVCTFGKGKTPDLKKLELAIHRPHSLYVEADK